MKKILLILAASALGSGCPLVAQTLAQYFKIAAENNPGLRAKYKEFEMAWQKIPQASTLPDPTMAFSYSVSGINTSPGMETRLIQASLEQTFPWFGTLKAQKDAATIQADAKYKQFIYSRNELYYTVATAYYSLLESDSLLGVERENIRLLELYKKIAVSRYENGAGAMVDILRADIALQTSRTDEAILQQIQRPLETVFNKLLNVAEDSPIPRSDTLHLIELPVNYRRDSLTDAHPLIDALTLKEQAAKAARLAAHRQGLPRMGIGLGYMRMFDGQMAEAGMMMSRNGSMDVFSPKLSMSLPIFRGKYKAAEKEAQLASEAAALQREELSNNLTSKYENLLFELQKRRDLITLYDQNIVTAQQAVRLLFTAYSNSGQDFEETLRMQQQLLSYQKMKVQTMTIYHTALAELNLITSKQVPTQ